MKGLYAENFFNSRKCILLSIKYFSQTPYEGIACLKFVQFPKTRFTYELWPGCGLTAAWLVSAMLLWPGCGLTVA